MNKIYSLLFASLFLFAAVACSDDNLYEEEKNQNQVGPGFGDEGESLNVFIENMGLRTRDVDFEEEAPVRVNSYWLGVFDFSNGNLVSSYSSSMGYAFLSSGNMSYGLIRHKLQAPSSNTNGNFFIVALVNYNDVKGSWSSTPDQLEDLSTMLNQVNSWEKFNSIGIDTNSAYYTGSDHSNDAPLMAGFMSKAAYDSGEPSNSHIKINQFKQNATNPIALKMTGSQDNLIVNYSSGKYQTSGHTLYLRRLVSNFNFNITADDNISIESISYRKYNVPAAVYIIERTMFEDESEDKKQGNVPQFPENSAMSPNFGDLKPSTGYFSDEQDNLVDIHQSDDNTWRFSYQHFANKHWARKKLSSYADREKFKTDANGNKIFEALCNNNLSEINNHATYIELKMRVIDRVRNRCAQVVYYIHEGYTSDTDGSELNDTNDPNREYRLQDFSCARNMNYTYNIKVHGIDNLSVNAGYDDPYVTNSSIHHRQDITGTIWNIKYVNETLNEEGASDFGFTLNGGFDKYLTGKGSTDGNNATDYEPFTNNTTPGTTGTENNDDPTRAPDDFTYFKVYKNAITFKSDTPNLAFRIYGWNNESNGTEGFNYNFEESSFTNLNGMWPKSVAEEGKISHFFQDFNSLVEDYLKGRDRDQLSLLLDVYDDVDGRKKVELLDFLTGKDENGTKIPEMPEMQSAIETRLFESFKLRANDESAPVLSGKYLDLIITSNNTLDGTTKISWRVKMKFDIDMKNEMNIIEFMIAVNYILQSENEYTFPKNYDLIVRARRQNVVDYAHNEGGNYNYKYARCFYIGDRNGTVDPEDKCTRAIEIFAAIQGIDEPLPEE